jgi:signal transduction histidine kinase
MAGETFTVDTHLFRELGELLVGRDSTALVELIKNAYDADATEVIVHGQHLDDAVRGKIVVQDDGVGMNVTQFREGFLRIASRLKEYHNRRSPIHKRQYTGAKGIGRLAAHKLAKDLRVYSVPSRETGGSELEAVDAKIDWATIERATTLDDIRDTNAVRVQTEARPQRAKSGTRIELKNLRRKWTTSARVRFLSEVQTFEPPRQLVALNARILPRDLAQNGALLFDQPLIKSTSTKDPGFSVKLTGDFEGGEEYWQSLAESAQWVLEIDARPKQLRVKVNIVPTRNGMKEIPDAQCRRLQIEHPSPEIGPFFQARILIREGGGGSQAERRWMGRSSGIRVFMEGFRVLPYGEPGDDWLSLDADYKKRPRSLPLLSDPLANIDGKDSSKASDEDEGLLFLGNSGYFGAVFLTNQHAPQLQMLVNREGFVSSADFETVVKLLRIAIHLSVRVRAAAKLRSRQERRRDRIASSSEQTELETPSARLHLREAVELTVSHATDLAREARRLAADGNISLAQKRIQEAAEKFREGAEVRERLMTEGTMLRVLASVGTQMSAFVHEINSLLGTATAVEVAIDRVIREAQLPQESRRKLSGIALAVSELRRSVERQASYLTDVVAADARRRRSRQRLAERFDAAVKLVQTPADRKGITIQNNIPDDLRSPPMFPAEVTVVFSNLLTNAVKAAGKNGRVRATGRASADGRTMIRIENTGKAVNPEKGERWFRPFESTTIQTTDPVLGQGMGMGLTLTRNLLEEYGASISFVEPRHGFATAIEICFP